VVAVVVVLGIVVLFLLAVSGLLGETGTWLKDKVSETGNGRPG
jgi:hypothetical protein